MEHNAFVPFRSRTNGRAERRNERDLHFLAAIPLAERTRGELSSQSAEMKAPVRFPSASRYQSGLEGFGFIGTY